MAYCQLAQRNPYRPEVESLIAEALDEYSLAVAAKEYESLETE